MDWRFCAGGPVQDIGRVLGPSRIFLIRVVKVNHAPVTVVVVVYHAGVVYRKDSALVEKSKSSIPTS